MRAWFALPGVIAMLALQASCERPASPATPPAAPPAHSWISKETTEDGTEYGYSAALSQDELTSGGGSPTVLMFRYLGERGGVYSLGHSANGVQMVSTCERPCVVIKSIIADSDGSTVTRHQFMPGTVIGEAFTDALNGQLEVYRPTGQPAKLP